MQRCQFEERTVLGLPPLHLAFGLEGGDDVLYAVAAGIVVVTVGTPGVTGEAFALTLNCEIKGSSVCKLVMCKKFVGGLWQATLTFNL